MVNLGACGAGKTPPHLSLPLEASFYKIPGEPTPSPYVGVINLAQTGHDALKNGRYRVPAQGLVQLMITNPQKTGVKVFVVKYDFRKMPAKTTTFLRQRTFVEIDSPHGRAQRTKLFYAVHLRFLCTKAGRIYLHKEIRVVFSHRAPDMSDKVKTITEGPGNPVFSSVARSSSASSLKPPPAKSLSELSNLSLNSLSAASSASSSPNQTSFPGLTRFEAEQLQL